MGCPRASVISRMISGLRCCQPDFSLGDASDLRYRLQGAASQRIDSLIGASHWCLAPFFPNWCLPHWCQALIHSGTHSCIGAWHHSYALVPGTKIGLTAARFIWSGSAIEKRVGCRFSKEPGQARRKRRQVCETEVSLRVGGWAIR